MIIIPTYNERKNIRPLVERIRKVLPEIRVLFVDDSSADGTGEEIKNLQISDPNIYLLTRPGKAGFASAYLDGFKYILEKFQPEFIITMDADLSHPPEKIPELIEIVKAGKVGIGSRYVKGGAVHNWKLRRRILSRLGNFYARFLTKLAVRDLTGGFMAIPQEFLQKLDLNSVQSSGYAFLMELKFTLSKIGAVLAEVPITFEERREGESKIAGSIVAEGLKYPLKIFYLRQVKENYPAWLIFFISLIIYIFTLPRAIFFGDSAEFMAAASSLGIPHPPGYPGYVLVAKLFTFLPFSSLEFRIGLFSALCGSLSLVVFYFLFQKIIKSKLIGFITSLFFGFTYLFWSQAIMSKVYMPLLLLTLTILLLIAKFWETKQSKYLVWTAFLFGFGSGFHQVILLFTPLLLFAILVRLRQMTNPLRYKFKMRSLIAAVALFLLGISVFVYLPIRASQSGDYYNFSEIFRTEPIAENFSGFKNYVLRAEYNDYGGKFNRNDKIDFFTSFLDNLWQQFNGFLVLAGIGVVSLWFVSRKFFVLTLGLFFLNVFGIILLRTSSWNYENEFLYSFYYLPAFAMTALWTGVGLSKIFETNILRNLGLVILVLPLFMFTRNYPTQNLSDFTFVGDYTTQVLESLPQDAVLLAHFTGSNTDTLLFGFHYQQISKNIRPDVTIMTIADVYPEVDRKILAAVYGFSDAKLARYNLVNYTIKRSPNKNRPIYTTFLTDDLSEKVNWSSVSNGLVYKFVESGYNYINNDLNHYKLDYEKDLKVLENDLFGLDLISQYFYTQAAYWAGQKDLHQAQENFINAIKYDYKVMGEDQKAFMFYRSRVFENN